VVSLIALFGGVGLVPWNFLGAGIFGFLINVPPKA
jgi:nitric oxide reductase large subunit